METTEKVKHRCKRLRAGKYLYRGVEITCLGYYEPEHRVVWEGSLINPEISWVCPCGDYHGYSLREVKMFIDEDLDKAQNMEMKKWSIGDWIYLFDPADKEESKEAHKISEVRDNGIRVSMYNDIYEEDWFEPIPITTEILEKNGLMRVSDEEDYEAYCCNDFLIRRSKFSCTDWWQVDVHYKQYVAHLSGYIQYVHQLQHLLTINECDKKIEL